MKDETTEMMVDGFLVKKGNIYEYAGGKPENCQGHLYQILGFVLYVPVYTRLVLVEALSGPDKGLKFVCSPANFASRYKTTLSTTDEKGGGI